MMNPKLVICDIDGTLVVKYAQVGDYTRKIINIIHDHGILFALATGRPYIQSKNIIAGYNLPIDFSISSNGAEIYDYQSKEYLKSDFMKPEWIRETIKIMEPFNGDPKLVTADGVQMSRYLDDYVVKSASNGDLSVKVVKTDEDFCVECPKIMFNVKEQDMPEIEKYLASLNLKEYYGFKTQPFLIEFVSRKVGKDIAMKRYCNKLNIDLKDVMAFGDTSNDNEMLKAAGVGVCLANGSPDTKTVAKYITKLDVANEGLAHFIEEEIIIPNGWE